MENLNNIYVRYAAIISTVLILANLWEFVLEDITLHKITNYHVTESLGERLEFIFTAVLFSFVSLIIPFKFALKRIKEREAEEREQDKLIKELRVALDEVKTLKGIIPICSHCKHIRDDKGAWSQVEEYVSEHTEAEFSHGICPKCMQKHYPEEYEDIYKKKKPE